MTEEIIAKYLSRQCTPQELEELVQWVEESPENARMLMEFEKTSLAAKSIFSSHEDSTQKAWETLNRRISLTDAVASSVNRSRRRSRIMSWIGAAACLAIVATVGIGLLLQPSSPKMISIATADTTMLLTLPDSTTVWLNRNSHLEYPETFADNSREVTLHGEAYFCVAKNQLKPFTIDGPDMAVTVTGTRFDMKSDKNGINEVSLIEGSVRVSPNGTKDGVDLRAGQKLSLDAATGTITVSELHTALDAVWTNNVIPFRHANIRSIAEALEYLYGVTVHIGKDIDCNRTYSGGMRHSENIDTVLDDMVRAIPVRYTVKGSDIYLSRR